MAKVINREAHGKVTIHGRAFFLDLLDRMDVLWDARHWNFEPILKKLRDPEETLRQDEREFIADLIESRMKRPKKRPPDPTFHKRATSTYLVFRAFEAEGDQRTYAIENAAKECGYSRQTARKHIEYIEESVDLKVKKEKAITELVISKEYPPKD